MVDDAQRPPNPSDDGAGLGSSRAEELYDLYLESALAGETRELEDFLEDHGVRDDEGAGELIDRLEQIRSMAGPHVASRPAAEGLPHEQLGEFRLLDRLGEGAMGVVYLAEQTSLGRLVALKVVRDELVGSGRVEVRFESEARALARIEHRGVVRLYGFGSDQGVRYLAMEFVPGESLHDCVERAGALPAAEVARIGLELAQALEQVHGAGLLHRDVKPSNVRLHEDGHAVLVDFGLSRVSGSESMLRSSGFVGSLGYAAPEQVRGNVELDGRADIYSLGAMLYHALSGAPPFAGREIESMLHAILDGDVAPLRRVAPTVPRDLATVVAAAMEREPRRRYQSAAALAADLEAVLSLRPITARPPGRIEVATKWVRRNRTTALTGLVALLSLLTLSVVLVLQGRWEDERLRNEARAALEQARAAVERHRVDRESMGNLDIELNRLASDVEHGHMRAVDRERYWELVDEVEDARRRRAGVSFLVLDALARAERLDPALADDAAALRAELLIEQWRDALVSGRLDELRAIELELESGAGAGRSEPFPTKRLVLDLDPDARHWIFVLRELSEIDPGATPRQVPVPLALRRDGDVWRADRDLLDASVAPGQWVLRPAADGDGFDVLDRVVTVDGHGIQGGPFVASDATDGTLRRGDRIVSVRGEPVRDAVDVRLYLQENLLARRDSLPAAPTVGFLRDGEQRTLPVETLDGVELLDLADWLERRGGRAEVLREGRLEELAVPPGIRWRTSAMALTPLDGNRVRESGTLELERGHYVFLSHAPGRAPMRAYAPIDVFAHDLMLRLEPQPLDHAPAGLRHYAIGGTKHREFWIGEFELTAAEYLEFLDDPDTLAEVDAAWVEGRVIRVPRGGGGRFARRTLWPRRPDGRFELADDVEPDMPVLGISYDDAQAYVAWRNLRGEPGDFALGGQFDHAAAAAYAGDRRFSYGSRFDPRAGNTCFSRAAARPERVGSHPVDESPLGIYDLCGNAAEFVEAWFDRANGYRHAIGGAWGQAPGDVNVSLGGWGHRPDSTTGETGMRLVWTPEGEGTR